MDNHISVRKSDLEGLEIRGQIETIQMTELLSTTRIFRKVLKILGDFS